MSANTIVTNEMKVQPYRDACQGHIKRKKLLRKIETKIATMEDVPVSLLSLYRGLLRDYEASSYKLMAMQPAPKESAPRKEQSSAAQLEREIKEEMKQWRNIEANQPSPPVQTTPKVPLMRLDNSIIRKLSVSSMFFFAMCLTLLAEYAQCLPRSLLVVQGVQPVVERLQTDTQLVGSSGLVPLMLVQYRKDMLHFNILQGSISPNSSHAGSNCPHRYRI
jgi:hypothetical protein